jgi:type IV fimbrial biogenesis protein FimT
MRCRQIGFTFTECLIVLAILAVIAAGSVPFLGKLMATTRLTANANALLTSLQQARANAWRSNEAWTLCLTDDGARCKPGRSGLARGWLILPRVLAAAGLAGAQRNAGLPDQRSALLTDDLTLHGTRLAVTYWPLSRSGTTATLTLCPTRDQLSPRQIIISQTGRPRIAIVARSTACPVAR